MPPGWDQMCIPGTWRPAEVTCTFKPSRLTGTVADHLGRPVAGMCIGAQGAIWSHSDSSGRWDAELSGLHDVVALIWDCASGFALGYQAQYLSLRFEIGRTTETHVAVVPLAGIRGRVLDQNGAPVSGTCLASGGRQDQPPVGPTGTDGAFELRRVQPGNHQLFVAPCSGSSAMTLVELEQTFITTAPGTWSEAQIVVLVGSALG